MKAALVTSTLAAFARLASASLQFHSRPELATPCLNITKATYGSLESGLIFVAPYGGFGPGDWYGPTQPGAYIYREDGELVWSGIGYHAGWVANFVPDNWNGQLYLRAFQGTLDSEHGRMFGIHTLLDHSYRAVKVVTAGAHKWVSAHEFNLVGGKTALIEVPVPVVASLKPWGGNEDQNWVISSGFQGTTSHGNIQLSDMI